MIGKLQELNDNLAGFAAMVNDKWLIRDKMVHVQPINHLSLTIDRCALRAHKV